MAAIVNGAGNGPRAAAARPKIGKPSYSAAEICALLLKIFPEPAFALLPQVPDGTGRNQSRTADAVAMSVWPSRGLFLHGFEIKVYRNDWLRELKNPEKADSVANRCHFWWVVAPEGIVHPEELPPEWGLLVPADSGPKDRTLRRSVEAKLREPLPIDPGFLAGILRRAASVKSPAANLRREYQRGLEAGKCEAKKTEIFELSQLRKAVAKFEEESGVRIVGEHDWLLGNVGAAVNVVRRIGPDALRPWLESQRDLLGRFIGDVEAALAHLGPNGKLATVVEEERQ